jgi:hypothetical protein
MERIAEIILTSALTLLGGVLVFVLGQIAIKFFLEPIHEFKKFLGEIEDALIFYANLPAYDQANEGTRKAILEAKDLFRQQAGRLMAKKKLIPWYKCLVKLRILASEENVVQIHRDLIGLSNSMMAGEYDDVKYFRENIIKNLK